MNAKEFLSRAWRIEQQVQSKQEQIEALKSLACRVTSGIGNEPVSHTRNVHAIEDTVLKIYEMNRELDAQIDVLVDKKIEISRVIARVQNVLYRLVLEKRYLTFCIYSSYPFRPCLSTSSSFFMRLLMMGR